MRYIRSGEFLERYVSGEREFSGIMLNYTDLSGKDLRDVVIRESKIIFVDFSDCNLQNSRFINCEIFDSNFSRTNLETAIFEGCTIDLALFENCIVRNTKILKSSVSLSLIINMPMGEFDISSSKLFRVFTDRAQVTEKDVEGMLSRALPLAKHFDISTKIGMRAKIARNVEKYGLRLPGSAVDESSYESRPENAYSSQQASYGTSKESVRRKAYKKGREYNAGTGYKNETRY